MVSHTRYLSLFLCDMAALYEGGGAGIPKPRRTGGSSGGGLSLSSLDSVIDIVENECGISNSSYMILLDYTSAHLQNN